MGEGGRKVMMSSGQNEDEELPNAAGFVWPTVRKLRHKKRKLEHRLLKYLYGNSWEGTIKAYQVFAVHQQLELIGALN
jgi:hypothetical protein